MVTDKGQMLADSDPDETTQPMIAGTAAGEAADETHVDVISILISADNVMDVKKK